MLLIFSPVAKPSEPPPGIARLAATLQAHHVPCTMLDANLEGLLWLLEQAPIPTDRWTLRAYRHRRANLAALRTADTYTLPARYNRAVRDLQRLLQVSGSQSNVTIGLADYRHQHLSPLRSADLLLAAEYPEQNPLFPWFSQRLPDLIRQELASPSPLVGFSLNYLSQALCTFAMIGYIKQHFPGLPIAVGGGLVTSWVRRPTWQNPFTGLIDHVLSGGGEQQLLSLLGVEQHIGILPVPDYSTLPLTEYLAPGLILPFSSAGGCYWNRCSFCPEMAEGTPYTPLPAVLATDQLHSLVATHHPALIHILDNAISPRLLHEVIRKPLPAPWYGFTRFSNDLTDRDFCMELRRSGCVMLKLGLESGDQQVLDKLGKGIDLQQASAALKNLHRAGIKVYCYVLFGTPAENAEAAHRTFDFVRLHHQAITYLNLAVFAMPLSAATAANYHTSPFYEADLSLYTNFSHPVGWDRKQIRHFINATFRSNPQTTAIMKQDPPLFTSNHAALFCNT